MKRYVPTGLAILLAVSAGAGTARTAGNSYSVIVIEPFSVQQGIDLPQGWLPALQDEVLAQLEKKHTFQEVLRSGEKPAAGEGRTVTLAGNIIEFHKGSRAKRYVLGPAFGKTRIVAHVRFVDAASGKVVWEKDVDGKVLIGVLGGDSRGAVRGLAKEIAKNAKSRL